FIYYRYFQKFAVFILIANLFLLILIFTPLGFSHAGASRWIDIGGFTLQPAELLKFSFLIYIAAWLSPKSRDGAFYETRQKSFAEGFLPFILISGFIASLVFTQRSTSVIFIVLLAAIILYFVSGARLSYVAGIIIMGTLAFSVVIYYSPYRFSRVASFIERYSNPVAINTQTTGYHLNQSLIAIGSGGLTGVGFGKSTTKYKYLPESIGDSIFAVLAEELGFVGVISLLAFFAFFFLRGFMIARKSRDQFARLTAIGFVSVMAIQAFVNIAAISGLLPLTGVPLPFISYGGTSLAVFLTMAGTIVNISRYT
ncbi:MAG: FtsW/RodA/SpoVE family cell cycle protein, partial [Candidatus Wolfebacteria bacterium]|nr:FtsW/RodA/SpoVE family cell cycle protein [Candidatus Wolfebacteria bacterium]